MSKVEIVAASEAYVSRWNATRGARRMAERMMQ